MTVDSRDPETALEFVHVTTPRDLRECRRLAATPGLSSAGIEGAFWWDDRTDPEAPQHAFLLRHRGEVVATLCVREPAAAPGRRGSGSAALRGLATREREGGGCSYRLLLLLWSTQWLATHRSVRTLMAVCRTDTMHRYTALGFTAAGRWFHAGGADGHSCVAITAEASRVVEAGRELDLDRVLDSALSATGGRALLGELMSTAA
jgi:hypothetical protein